MNTGLRRPRAVRGSGCAAAPVPMSWHDHVGVVVPVKLICSTR